MVTERIKQMWHDEGAVSPVIGVILMVAVTVVLAAVIGAFVFGIGDSLGDPAPSTQVDFDYDADNDDVEILHDGGESLTTDNTGVVVINAEDSTGSAISFADPAAGTPGWGSDFDAAGGSAFNEATVTSSVSAGETIYDSATDTGNSNAFDSGSTVELVWNSPDGGTSQVIGSWEAP